MQGISKRFGRTLAVDGVDFEARPGEVTALLGENGAGKSTLMKLLYGMHRPDAGGITLAGQAATIHSPRDAMRLGIGMVFQQFSLIPAITVRENLALVLPHAPWWMGRGARRLELIARHLRSVVPEVDADARVADLSVGQIQLVELAKVLLLDARCVILDEPSAVLAPPEAQRLWALMRELAARGLAVVLITHKLHDVQACADRVFVMRGGRLAGQASARGLDDAAIVELMVGQAPPAVREPPPLAATALTRLWVKGVCAGPAQHVDLQIRRGEVVGIAGVSGNGQTALAEAITGMRALSAGEVILDGQLLRAPRFDPVAAPRLGYIPEQPLVNAVAPDLPLWVNLALKRIAALPFVPSFEQLRRDAAERIALFGVRPADPLIQARWLSGGNLQKLVAARELADAPAAVVACYPTMGLDITASAQVYEALFEQARQGSAVLWISEDLDDLLRHAHRIAVMVDGRIVKLLCGADTSLAEIGAWMTGVVPEAVAA
jgi:simple sugar transport system ATP-binding protein